MRLILAAVMLCLSFVAGAAVTITESTVVSLYRGTSKVGDRASWDDCRAEARRLAEASAAISGTVTYSCKTEVRKLVASYRPNPAPVNCAVSDWSACTGGTWSACAGGTQTRTGTRSRTVVTQPAHGGSACPALSEPCTASQACTMPTVGQAVLRWTPPVLHTDGTAIAGLRGYTIHLGRAADQLSDSRAHLFPTSSSATVTNLAAGTWYFCVRALNENGEGPCSNVVTKTVL